MSDEWGHYFADMGGKPASIAFDDGISAEIDALDYPNSLKLKIELHEIAGNGLPVEAEGDRLMVLDGAIEDAITTSGGVYLGRVTNKGVRWVMALAPAKTKHLEQELERLAAAAGYKIETIVKADPQKRIYWEDLYPTEDDRRVMKDMSVVQALQQRNDIADIKRPVDHWTYFDKGDTAQEFANWLEKNGYENIHVEKQKDDVFSKPRWCVRSVHIGTMLLDNISRHTLAHMRQAEMLGGQYDGWETQIIRGDD